MGSFCLVKRLTTGLQTFRWWRGWNGGAEVAEITVKRLLCCGFRYTGKAMGQVYQCWWRICREINVVFFQFRMSYILRFMSIRDLLTGSPSCLWISWVSIHSTWHVQLIGTSNSGLILIANYFFIGLQDRSKSWPLLTGNDSYSLYFRTV
jgi:hypothetical protein